MTLFNGSELSQLAQQSDTALQLTKELANRQRDRKETDLSRLHMQMRRKGKIVVESDYRAYWKAMEGMGMGSVIYGRNGGNDLFRWNYSLKEVAKAAIKGKDQQVDLQPLDLGKEKAVDDHEVVEATPPIKKRGRPKGSKNRTKRFTKEMSATVLHGIRLSHSEVTVLASLIKRLADKAA